MASAKVEELEEKVRQVGDQMRTARDDRDTANLRVKAIIESMKKLKEARDIVNKQIRELKEERNRRNARVREVIGNIRKERENVRRLGLEDAASSKELSDFIDKLDFEYQTIPRSFEAEKALIARIEDLRKKLQVKLIAEKRSGTISKLGDDIEQLREEAQAYHKKVMETAETSERLHDAFIARTQEIQTWRKKSDEAHQNFLKLRESFLKARDELAEERRREHEEHAKKMAAEMAERDIQLKSQAEQLEKKLNTSTKFSIHELQFLMETGKPLPKAFGKVVPSETAKEEE